jgi:hypothetical protein
MSRRLNLSRSYICSIMPGLVELKSKGAWFIGSNAMFILDNFDLYSWFLQRLVKQTVAGIYIVFFTQCVLVTYIYEKLGYVWHREPF